MRTDTIKKRISPADNGKRLWTAYQEREEGGGGSLRRPTRTITHTTLSQDSNMRMSNDASDLDGVIEHEHDE